MENFIQVINWFQSLNTFVMVLVIAIVIWLLLKITNVVSRLVSLAFALIGLAKLYTTFFSFKIQ